MSSRANPTLLPACPQAACTGPGRKCTKHVHAACPKPASHSPCGYLVSPGPTRLGPSVPFLGPQEMSSLQKTTSQVCLLRAVWAPALEWGLSASGSPLEPYLQTKHQEAQLFCAVPRPGPKQVLPALTGNSFGPEASSAQTCLAQPLTAFSSSLFPYQ